MSNKYEVRQKCQEICGYEERAPHQTQTGKESIQGQEASREW